MYIMNEGHIQFPKKNEKEVVKLLVSNGGGDLFGIEKGDEFEPDTNGNVTIEINSDSSYGDIESKLYTLTEIFKNNGLLINGQINYYGDYEGRYIIENGDFRTETPSYISELSDEEIMYEVKRRGLSLSNYKDVDPDHENDSDLEY